MPLPTVLATTTPVTIVSRVSGSSRCQAVGPGRPIEGGGADDGFGRLVGGLAVRQRSSSPASGNRASPWGNRATVRRGSAAMRRNTRK